MARFSDLVVCKHADLSIRCLRQQIGETASLRRWRGTFPLTSPTAFRVLTTFMKVVSSIKSAKKRHPDCQVVRRKGRIYVINKTDPRYKARQG